MPGERHPTAAAIALIFLATPAPARAAEPMCDWLDGLAAAASRAAEGDWGGRLASAERALAARPAGPAAAVAQVAAAAALLAGGRSSEAAARLDEAARLDAGLSVGPVPSATGGGGAASSGAAMEATPQAAAATALRAWVAVAKGEALLGSGQAGEAAAALATAAALGDGPAARRARWLEARALLQAKRPEEAQARLEPLLRDAPGEAEARRGRLDLAEVERRLGRPDQALRRWRELALEEPDRPEGREAHEVLARWSAEPGAPAGARLGGTERLLRAERLLARGRAAEAWAEVDAAEKPGGDAASPSALAPRLRLLRAFIRTGEGRLAEAEALALPLDAAGVPPGVRRGADLVLARAAGRAGRAEEASRRFLRVAAGHEPVPGLGEPRNRELADEAAFLAAWLWLDAGDPARAVERLDAFAAAHPRSHRTEAARWFAAWARVRLGDAAGARKALAGLERGAYADAARYWGARLAANPAEAARLLGKVEGRSDDGWYLWLARARLGGDAGPAAGPGASPGAGPVALEPIAAPAGPAAERLAAGAALLTLGWPEAARAELDAAARLPRARGAPGALAELAAFAGDVELAYRVARDQLGVSRRTLRWLYPSPRPAALEAATAGAGLDPDLLRAVLRRESAFRPEARSAAGAEGLAQLLPATARRLAALSGLDAQEPPRLSDPGVSVSLAAQYLGLLRDRLGGDAAALAGYNAGPAPAAAWALARAGLPLDEWVESIPYRETRAYVKGVLSSREVYRRLRGLPAVALARRAGGPAEGRHRLLSGAAPATRPARPARSGARPGWRPRAGA